MASGLDITQFLPDSLNLPPHLSAHKYFFVCTLTVAAWDTLVLSPRSWRLLKTPEWPPLKIIFNILRILMPAEFIIVAVAFFDTSFTSAMCNNFYLFEPITTAVIINLCAITHAIRMYAIYDKSMSMLGTLGGFLLAQVAAMAVACAFYRPMPLKDGQGCIAGPQHTWVGVYWAFPTAFFLTTFVLALNRSRISTQAKPLGAWKLMLRDGLNLYGAVAGVNLVNLVYWFAVQPTDDADTIKTIVTSMAAVLTTTMTLRIILGVRGSLVAGGAYAGTSTAGAGSATRGTTHVISTRGTGGGMGGVPQPGVVNIGSAASAALSRTGGQAYTLEEMRAKAERDYYDQDGVSEDAKAVSDDSSGPVPHRGGVHPGVGVKVTIDREVDFRGYGKQ